MQKQTAQSKNSTAKVKKEQVKKRDDQVFPPVPFNVFEDALKAVSRRTSEPDKETKETSESYSGGDCNETRTR